MTVWIAFGTGLFVGGIGGALCMSMLILASQADDELMSYTVEQDENLNDDDSIWNPRARVIR